MNQGERFENLEGEESIHLIYVSWFFFYLNYYSIFISMLLSTICASLNDFIPKLILRGNISEHKRIKYYKKLIELKIKIWLNWVFKKIIILFEKLIKGYPLLKDKW